MFIGHLAPAFVAATLPRAPRLWLLVVAALLVDLVLAALVALGIEQIALVPGATPVSALVFVDVPWSHSLLGTLGWAGALALAMRIAGQDWRAATIAAAVVASHWPLDGIVHPADLTLAGGVPALGLGLWRYPALAMPAELAIAFVAVTWFAQHSRAVSLQGRTSLALLVAAMAVVQLFAWLGNRPVAPLDPAPVAVLLPGLLGAALLIALAVWTGRCRTVVLG